MRTLSYVQGSLGNLLSNTELGMVVVELAKLV